MSTDTRIRVTKKMIKDSFLDLLGAYPLDKISVTQICKKAEINRVTFYKYYQDVYDLYEKTVDELLDSSTHSMAEIYIEKGLREAIETTISDIRTKINQYYVFFPTMQAHIIKVKVSTAADKKYHLLKFLVRRFQLKSSPCSGPF